MKKVTLRKRSSCRNFKKLKLLSVVLVYDNNMVITRSNTTSSESLDSQTEQLVSEKICTKEYMKKITIYSFAIVKEFLTWFINICGMYFIWIILHYISSHLYKEFCNYNSWFGFLLSPILASAPHCQALRWLIYNGGNIIETMWVLLGGWLSCKLILKLHRL